MFKKGNPGGPGGARKNSGPKPSWFKSLCEEEMRKNKARGIRLVGEISRGEAEFEKAFNDDGAILKANVKPSAHEVIAANEFLRDSAIGKPTQSVTVDATVGVNIFEFVKEARQKRGLA